MKTRKATVVIDVPVTADITRKGTKAFQLAKFLSDGRRRGRPVSRKEIVNRLGFDPAPYVKMYECFVAVERGKYTYVGTNLAELQAA
jgi:hypothetical protein